jgi:hypothetical protein
VSWGTLCVCVLGASPWTSCVGDLVCVLVDAWRRCSGGRLGGRLAAASWWASWWTLCTALSWASWWTLCAGVLVGRRGPQRGPVRLWTADPCTSCSCILICGYLSFHVFYASSGSPPWGPVAPDALDSHGGARTVPSKSFLLPVAFPKAGRGAPPDRIRWAGLWTTTAAGKDGDMMQSSREVSSGRLRANSEFRRASSTM